MVLLWLELDSNRFLGRPHGRSFSVKNENERNQNRTIPKDPRVLFQNAQNSFFRKRAKFRIERQPSPFFWILNWVEKSNVNKNKRWGGRTVERSDISLECRAQGPEMRLGLGGCVALHDRYTFGTREGASSKLWNLITVCLESVWTPAPSNFGFSPDSPKHALYVILSQPPGLPEHID